MLKIWGRQGPWSPGIRLSMLLKYPLIMLRLDAMLYSNLVNENSDADHMKCLLGPHLAGGPQISHPCLRSEKSIWFR